MLFRRTTENAVTYTFKHALVQDTAYDSLLRSSRRDWHRRIAEVLEQRVDEGLADPPELIAIHYSRAGLAEQSIPWWLRAGRLAATGFANLEACDHYRAGVKDLTQAQLIEDRESLEIELQLQLGRAMMTTEGYGSEAVGDAYRHVLTLVTRTGDVNRQFSVLRGLTTNKYFRGEYGEAITYAKRALGIAQAHDDPAMIMRAEISLGQVHFITGNPQAGLELFDAALERARTEGREAARGIQDIDLMALTLGALALIMTGFADQAVARVTEAVEGAGRLSQWLSQSQAFSHLAMIHVWRGEPDQAIDAAQRSIALAEQYGFSDWRLQSMVHYGCALTAKNGDPAGAAMVGEAIGDLRRPGFVGSMPVYLSLYAGSLATLGRLDEAILVADDARRASADHSRAARYYEVT